MNDNKEKSEQEEKIVRNVKKAWEIINRNKKKEEKENKG